MDKKRLATLPTTSGVYLFKDRKDRIIYVGKAKKLRTRVRNYFSGKHDAKTTLLVSKIVDVETISTRNEVEALLLENDLINRHRPQYNIVLRESRRYAWIRVTKEAYPRILTSRTTSAPGKYFGPYTDGTARRGIILALNNMFKLRTCGKLPKKVCLQYHIENCAGPCEQHISQTEYNQRIGEATKVLSGDTKKLEKRYTKQMRVSAEKKQFEKAKEYRDLLYALKEIHRSQIVEREKTHDEDVIGYTTDENDALFAVLHINRGVIVKKREYRMPLQEHLVEDFLKALYRVRIPPREIITSGLEDHQKRTLEAFFSELAGLTVHISCPQRGDKKKLLLLAEENAAQSSGQDNVALQALQKSLHLPAAPLTIDCFDVSTHQGKQTVAASVRYRNGKPDPSGYRRFIIRSATHDDFASMQEAVSRRYREGDTPDLIVVDGGKGQLSAARIVSPKGVPIIALAKKHEEVFVPGLSKPLVIKQKNPGLLLLRRIRDATHRQAVGFHRLRSSKYATESVLDHITGIGPKKKEALYKKFKNFSVMKKASKEQLIAIVGEKAGLAVYEALHTQP